MTVFIGGCHSSYVRITRTASEAVATVDDYRTNRQVAKQLRPGVKLKDYGMVLPTFQVRPIFFSRPLEPTKRHPIILYYHSRTGHEPSVA